MTPTKKTSTAQKFQHEKKLWAFKTAEIVIDYLLKLIKLSRDLLLLFRASRKWNLWLNIWIYFQRNALVINYDDLFT